MAQPDKPLTVEELIVELGKLDPKLTVEGEGCDCINRIVAVSTFEHRGKTVALLEVNTNI